MISAKGLPKANLFAGSKEIFRLVSRESARKKNDGRGRPSFYRWTSKIRGSGSLLLHLCHLRLPSLCTVFDLFRGVVLSVCAERPGMAKGIH